MTTLFDDLKQSALDWRKSGYACEVSLPNGAKAKTAFYFKTQDHLDDSRPWIEQAMTRMGESVSQILVNTPQSSSTEVDEFTHLYGLFQQVEEQQANYEIVEKKNTESIVSAIRELA